MSSPATGRLALPINPVLGALAVATAAALAIVVGTSLGNPAPGSLLLLAAAAAVPVYAAIFLRPIVGLLIAASSVFCLVVVAITDDSYLNGLDVAVPVVLAVAFFGRTRMMARQADATEIGPPHEQIRRITKSFERWTLLYFGLAALSLVPLAVRIGTSQAVQSAVGLTRAFEGALIFPLTLWCIRSERDVRLLLRVVFVAAILLGVVNVYKAVTIPETRGGMTWILNHPEWPLEGVNEAAAAVVMVWTLVLVLHAHERRSWDYAVMALVFVTLILTQSRSGLIMFTIVTVMTARRLPTRYIIAGVVLLGLVLLAAPPAFWNRMIRSVTLTQGSYEVYSGMIRVYGYISSVRAFLANWLIGLGYLGGRYVSEHYNELRIKELGSENFFLETAVGMGVIGFAVMLMMVTRLFQLGRVVRKVAPPGTIGYDLARFHVPLMVALVFTNMVADQWVGMVGIGEVALWCGLLVRAGHLAARDRPS